MVKCKTLNDITYKNQWRKIGAIINVDSKDVEKLERIGAVQCLETIPKPEIKINVIKNPIKTEKVPISEKKEMNDLFDEDESTEKPKRKYNKRRDFRKRRY